MHELNRFVWSLATEFNASVIIPAHPRKRGQDQHGLGRGVSLRNDPEGFFEEVMGISHFVNSCSSLWGIERDLDTDRTDFLCGAQRFTGQQNVMRLEKQDDDQFRMITDQNENLTLALTTAKRKQAWEMLRDGPFSYSEAEQAAETCDEFEQYVLSFLESPPPTETDSQLR